MKRLVDQQMGSVLSMQSKNNNRANSFAIGGNSSSQTQPKFRGVKIKQKDIEGQKQKQQEAENVHISVFDGILKPV